MPVTNSKLGNKLTCHSCGAKFYDLKKKQPVCPKCGADYVIQKPKTRRGPAAAEPAPAPTPAPIPDAKETEEEDDGLITTDLDDELLDEDDHGGDNSVMEDASDIGGDEEDIGEVIGSVDGASDENA